MKSKKDVEAQSKSFTTKNHLISLFKLYNKQQNSFSVLQKEFIRKVMQHIDVV